MLSRIVLDEETLNAALAHFLQENIDSPVQRIRAFAHPEGIRLSLSGIKAAWLSLDFEAVIRWTFMNNKFIIKPDFQKTAGMVQQILSHTKADSLLLYFFPSLRERPAVRVLDVMTLEIDLSEIDFQIGEIGPMKLTQFMKLDSLRVARSDENALLIAEFKILPPLPKP